MKNLSLILNAVLIVAVAFLFYQVHELKQGAAPAGTEATDAKEADAGAKKPVNVAVNGPSSLADAKIAYVNTDSINEKYQFIIDATKSLRDRKNTLERQMESMSVKFQKEVEEYQKSAQAGIMPQSEMARTEEGLKKQQTDLANKQMQMENLALELDEKNVALQKSIKAFLAQHNNGRFDYVLSYSDMLPTILLTNAKLDITREVINGLNEEYKQNKGKK